MVDVNLWAGLRHLAGGDTVVPVQAATPRQMLAALVAAHPGLDPVIKAGVSIVVNGEMITDLNGALPPYAEVHLMARIKGG